MWYITCYILTIFFVMIEIWVSGGNRTHIKIFRLLPRNSDTEVISSHRLICLLTKKQEKDHIIVLWNLNSHIGIKNPLLYQCCLHIALYWHFKCQKNRLFIIKLWTKYFCKNFPKKIKSRIFWMSQSTVLNRHLPHLFVDLSTQ